MLKKKLGQFSKNYGTFYPKICHRALKTMGLTSGIRDPGSGKNIFRIPDPGTEVKKAPDPGSRSATLVKDLYSVIFKGAAEPTQLAYCQRSGSGSCFRNYWIPISGSRSLLFFLFENVYGK